MKVLCVFGQYNYGNSKCGEGYEYKNFIPALRRLGHEVILFDSWDKEKYNNFADLNKELLCVAEKEKPDFILCVHILYEVWIETIDILREWGHCVVNWSTDDDWKYAQFSKLLAPHYDAFATTHPHMYEQYHKDGIYNVVLTQWAANAESSQEPLPAEQCYYSVTFIGLKYGKREQWINLLKNRGIDVNCFGYGWETGPVSGDEIPQIIRKSVISLNFSDSSLQIKNLIPRRIKQIKARNFEVPGAGGMLLTENAPGIEKYYVLGKEIETFTNLDELVEKINYYLNNNDKRDDIAYAGNIRTCKEHIYDERMKDLIGSALEIKEKNNLMLKKLQRDRDWKQRFSILEDRHKVNKSIQFFRDIIIKTLSMVFGYHRSIKFARRIVYEVSWRIYGKNVYTAKGWPGRLFYKEY